MYRHYTILNHLIHHPMNQKQACICQAHHHGMPVLSFPLIQAWAIYLQMNYHPLHHLGQCCNHHQILITKFLVSTFFMIFYFTSFLQGPHISFLRWHWYLEAFAITPWYPIFQFDIKWLPICSNISHIWRFFATISSLIYLVPLIVQIEQDVTVSLEDSHPGKPWPRTPLI